jgi:methylated-DNA-[protein]-cysteine S-methyltransferase
MKDVERMLRAGRPTVNTEAAAERFAQRASREGLLDVAYSEVESPIGTLLVATTSRGLVRVVLTDGHDDALEEIAARVSPRVLRAPARTDAVRRELDEYFARRRNAFDVPLDWRLATGFNRRVLEATARIPFGSVSSYGDMARAAGSPRAARAAGNALHRNPIPIVVPCHRVVHSGGGLGGYGGGLDRKRYLLRLEGALRG